MALLLIDGFDHEGLWPAASRVQGRRPSSGALGLRLGASGYLKTLDASSTSLILGVAIRVPSLSLSEPVLLGVGDASSRAAHLVKLGQVGQINLYRVQGGYASLIVTSIARAPARGWHYLELQVIQGRSDGRLSVRLNGLVAIDLAAQDTILEGGLLRSCFVGAIPGQACPASLDVDDLYIADTSGDIHNTFLGDVRVDTSVARVSGHWVAGGLAQRRQSFGVEPLRLSNPGSIAGVQMSLRAQKTEPRWSALQAQVTGSTQALSAPASPLQSTPTWHRTMFERPPNGQTHWSPQAFNAAQFGVEVA